LRWVTRRWAVSALAAAAAGAHAGAAAAAGGPGWPSEAPLGPPQPFSFERLQQQARALAARPHQPPPTPPNALALDYDAFGQVRYKGAGTLWGSAAGDRGVRLFPLSRPAPRPVRIHVVAGGRARPVLYSPALFDSPPGSPLQSLGEAAGFGGFRVMNADHATDWLAFLGASYFRSADPFNQYGLSARGLAIDTAGPGPEEFPAFTAFWLEQAAPGDLVVYALLDGPSVTGAYRFAHSRSSRGLVQDVAVQLSFRRAADRLGLAPLTSMYWYGQSDRPGSGDWRPQIHDSDGLAIWTGAGERIWRPLSNPGRVTVNAYSDRGPRGFGLMQRDRAFADYQDDGVFYEKRPSLWVEPVGDWGRGAVQLVEIPTAGETDDNIVAFWTPAQAPAAGSSLDLRYRLHWCAEEPAAIGVAQVTATRFGPGGRPGQTASPGRRKFVIDFAGGALAGLTARGAAEAIVSASHGQPVDAVAYPVVGQGAWRLMFDLDAPPNATVDLRVFLRRGGEALTETWMYEVRT
jgi:glucans biosynthesis protein